MDFGFGGDGSPGSGPALPSGSEDDWFLRAEDFRRRQVWEESIRLYRFVLQSNPQRLDARLGLACSYEAKSREQGYESYLHSAIAEYRKMISQDPTRTDAHDGLLVTSAKANLLDDLLDEYKARIAKGGEVEAIRLGLRKIQAYLLLRANPTAAGAAPPPPLLGFLCGLMAPGVGFVCAAVSLLIRIKGEGNKTPLLVAGIFLKLSLFSFCVFLAYKIIFSWRTSR